MWQLFKYSNQIFKYSNNHHINVANIWLFLTRLLEKHWPKYLQKMFSWSAG